MDADFWHARWRDGRIGFHRPEVNPLLIEHLPRLGLAAGARVLVPLCGKTLDLGWLADQGFVPIGVEISPVAVADLFEAAGVTPTRDRDPILERWTGGGMEVLCGDFFHATPEHVGHVDALWDRAALIALPQHMRAPYVRHCADLLPAGASGLLVVMDYDPAEMDGPPFPVPAAEVEDLYGPWFDVELLASPRSETPPPHLRERGLRAVSESVWRLLRRDSDGWENKHT